MASIIIASKCVSPFLLHWNGMSLVILRNYSVLNRRVQLPLETENQFTRYYGKKKGHKIELTSDESSAVNMSKLRQEMTTVLSTLQWEYDNNINARITPKMVGGVSIKVGDKSIPLGELVQISLPSPQNIVINFSSEPSSMCGSIIQYLSAAVKELRDRFPSNPIVNDSIVKLPIPRPSKELRDKLVKDAKGSADKAKVTLRRVRQHSVGELRKKKDTLSKDSVKRIEEAIQMVTDEFNGSIDNLLKAKTENLYKS